MTISDARNLNTIVYENPEIQHKRVGNTVELRYGFGPIPAQLQNKKIFFFDIDNCLYRRSTKIHDLMQVKIHTYFKDNLKLNDEEAHELHMNYYKTYGLALEGLVRNHQVDALEYNSKVDDALDLSSVLSYDQSLRDMLISLKQDYDYFWLVTNAYKNHALRVISFLGVGDLFEGLTYCDYSKFPIICKPMPKYFKDFLILTQIDFEDTAVMKNQSFVDDSEINVKAAHNLGFGTVVHFVEEDSDLEKLRKKEDFEEYYGTENNSDKSKIRIIRNILELPTSI